MTENIVEAPKQEQAAETGKQIAASGKPQETAVQTATQPEQKANAGQNPAGKELKAETSAQASEKRLKRLGKQLRRNRERNLEQDKRFKRSRHSLYKTKPHRRFKLKRISLLRRLKQLISRRQAGNYTIRLTIVSEEAICRF